ncbi:hypothetical protein N8H74_23830 [Pseudomonas sp. B2M1-30]|uniref:hypothetical protein n=1 Tax=Pseudomonas TaxID=286 RepID=UPI0021C5A9B6|nr:MULTISPECIES: hypothetical protein [Pseudomonas]MCU0121307.1 hypothetical protein [Pseudomonas sp. B2M1-30]MCU7261161.1 hypothetical protein [Pseudomonas koreensis]
MAKRAEYLVIDGCVQDGRNVVLKGQPYNPPSKEVADALLSEGRIADIKDSRAQQLLQENPDAAADAANGE